MYMYNLNMYIKVEFTYCVLYTTTFHVECGLFEFDSVTLWKIYMSSNPLHLIFFCL